LEYVSQGISVAINDDVLPGNLDLLLGSYLGFLIYGCQIIYHNFLLRCRVVLSYCHFFCFVSVFYFITYVSASTLLFLLKKVHCYQVNVKIEVWACSSLVIFFFLECFESVTQSSCALSLIPRICPTSFISALMFLDYFSMT
jgi:hypothetical protein